MNQIPLFPHFVKLSLGHKDFIQGMIRDFPLYADYNFASLWSYNTEDDAEVSLLNDNLVILFRDYITNDKFYSFFGTSKVLETTSALLEFSKKQNLKEELKLISELTVKSEPALIREFNVFEDRGSHDYILSVCEITELKSSRYHTQKNHLNRFHTLYPDCRMELLDITRSDIREQIFDVFYRWEKGRKKSREDTQHELTALTRLIDASSVFQLLVLGVYDGDKLVGFTINDIEHPAYVQNHFAKSDPTYKEAYYKLNHALAHQLFKMGYHYLNIENDLNIPGLRYSKEQWNPIHYLKKYIISPK